MTQYAAVLYHALIIAVWSTGVAFACRGILLKLAKACTGAQCIARECRQMSHSSIES